MHIMWINEAGIMAYQACIGLGKFCTVDIEELEKIFWKFNLGALKKSVTGIVSFQTQNRQGFLRSQSLEILILQGFQK